MNLELDDLKKIWKMRDGFLKAIAERKLLLETYDGVQKTAIQTQIGELEGFLHVFENNMGIIMTCIEIPVETLVNRVATNPPGKSIIFNTVNRIG